MLSVYEIGWRLRVEAIVSQALKLGLEWRPVSGIGLALGPFLGLQGAFEPGLVARSRVG